MSDYEADTIDQPLQEWSRSRMASDEHLGRLAGKISSSIDQQLEGQTVSTATAAFSRHRVGRVLAFFGGAAAMLLVMLLIERGEPDKPTPSEPNLNFARLDADQLQHKQTLLQEMDHVFDDQLSWIVESQDDVRFAINETKSSVQGAQPLAVRLVVVRRNSEGGQWEQVWQADVISHSEQLIHLPDPSQDGARLTMWAYVLPDGNVGVDTNLAFDHLELQPAATTEIQQNGVPAQLSSQKVNGVEYQIYQTVALLDDNVG